MSTLIALFSSASAILAFFYKKEGTQYQIKGIGRLILFLVITLAALNVYNAISQNIEAQNSKQIAEEERNIAAKAQSAALMQYLDLEKPLSSAQIAFSISVPESTPGAAHPPFGNNQFGLFLDDESDRELGKFKINVGEIELIDITLRREKGKVEAISNYYDYKSGEERSVIYNQEGNCRAEKDPKYCDDFDEENAPWYFEGLASFKGDYHHGLNFQKIKNNPAIIYLSQIIQDKEVGVIKVNDGFLEANYFRRNIIRDYYNNRVHAEFRFYQPFSESNANIECSNTVLIEVGMKVIGNTHPIHGGFCEPKDICISLTNSKRVDVIPCEVQQF